MSLQTISNADARRIILQAQGLTSSAPFGQGMNGMINSIRHLSYVQLDTIAVIERAQHHILRTRNPLYQPAMLEKAQYQKREIFEYWSHAAAYLPMEHYRFSLPVMNIFKTEKTGWPASSKKDMKYVLDRIRDEGPLMSRHFESDHKGGTWWDWKPAKWALQRLFLEGTLMVSHREGFQRVYDLPERIIPAHIDTTAPDINEYYRHLILTTLQAQGIAGKKELIHLRHIDHHVFAQELLALEEDHIIEKVKTENMGIVYCLAHIPGQSVRIAKKIRFLSPFDNAVIWRKRLKGIFDFDYTLECYLPAGKRQYGYFTLPILYGDQFVGRLDMKAERKLKKLVVQRLHWETKNISKSSDIQTQYNLALQEFAAFNGCDTVEILRITTGV